MRKQTGAALYPVDLGKVIYTEQTARYFVNECQTGIGCDVVRLVRTNLKRFGGRFAFGIGAVKAILRNTAQKISVCLDNSQLLESNFIGIVIANGAYTGGGMKLAPHAVNNDGQLDVLLIYEQPLVRRLLSFPAIYTGRHINLPKFDYRRARTVSMSSAMPLCLEADGELIGKGPCEIRVIHEAIKVCVPARPE